MAATLKVGDAVVYRKGKANTVWKVEHSELVNGRQMVSISSGKTWRSQVPAVDLQSAW